MPIESPYAISY